MLRYIVWSSTTNTFQDHYIKPSLQESRLDERKLPSEEGSGIVAHSGIFRLSFTLNILP
jgi:hypothetical protein